MSDEEYSDSAADEDSGSQNAEEEQMVINPDSVRERIDQTLEILANLKSRKSESNNSRSDLISSLSRDLSEYYGYIPELCDLFLDLFPPAECVEFMEASDRPRPMVIRTNTLKTTRKDLMDSLGKRGSSLEMIEWSKVAIKVTEATVPIGATPEYLAGHYMLQSAASQNPVIALAPEPGERILDMSAAPGGKTSYIAQLMKNSGSVIANDLKPQRQKATVANLHRMGVKNAVVCCYDGRRIPQVMKGFDRVLLDAPCSGLGVIARDQSVKLQRTLKDIQRNAHLQKELLCAAVDAVDCNSATGGIVVYSTCSVSTEENEQVVDYLLKRRFVKLIDTGLEVGKPGFTRHKERRFHPSLNLTRRFYPHVHNMDGFYVAKIKKYQNGVKQYDPKEEEDEIDDYDYGDEDEDEDEDENIEEDASKNDAKKIDKKSNKNSIVDKKLKSNKTTHQDESNLIKSLPSDKISSHRDNELIKSKDKDLQLKKSKNSVKENEKSKSIDKVDNEVVKSKDNDSKFNKIKNSAKENEKSESQDKDSRSKGKNKGRSLKSHEIKNEVDEGNYFEGKSDLETKSAIKKNKRKILSISELRELKKNKL